MRGLALPLLALSSLALPGCVARAAADVVTAPVRIASKTVDLATTSQSEADEKRGREIRKREERLGKLERSYDKLMEDCADGNRRACDRAREVHREMQVLIPSIPVEPDEG